MKTETIFSKMILNELEYCLKDVPYHIFRVESNLTAQGIPDIFCCVNGHVFWIEVKTGGNELSPLQHAWHIRYADAGGLSFIVTEGKYYYTFGKGVRIQDFASDNVSALVKNLLRMVEEDASIRHNRG